MLAAESFDAAIESSTLTLVDFWAPWCGPCVAMAPVLDQLASDYEGRVVVAKVDVDDHPELAARFSVQSIPTMVLFRNGVELRRLVGARPSAQLDTEVSSLL